MIENWATYARPSPSLDDLAIACLGAGEFRGADEGFRGRRLRSYAAVVVSEGDGWFESPQLQLTITAPALIWLFPGGEHGYGPSPRGWTEHWILLGGPANRALADLAGWQRAAPVTALQETPARLAETFATLRTDLDDGGSRGSLRASATTYSWIAELAATTMPPALPDLIDAFTRDAARPMSMDARARLLGVTLTELRTVIDAATGLSPLQLLIESRLARAQSLLVETDLDISAIAQKVGFDDPAYFSRQFTRRRGLAPSIFRREQRRAPGRGTGRPT